MIQPALLNPSNFEYYEKLSVIFIHLNMTADIKLYEGAKNQSFRWG